MAKGRRVIRPPTLKPITRAEDERRLAVKHGRRMEALAWRREGDDATPWLRPADWSRGWETGASWQPETPDGRCQARGA